MKEYIYKQYLSNICDHMSIDPKDIFIKTKKPDTLESRQMLYFLCYTKANMTLTEIRKYTKNQGFHEDQANISRSVKALESRVKKDNIYIHIINKLDNINH